MAEKASGEAIAADMRPPNWRGAVKVLRGVKAKKDKMSGISGEIGQIFDKMAGFKVNKKAAKIFVTLETLELPERNDILRSLQGLIDAAEWDRDATDLVDQADGNVHHLRFARSGQPGGEDGNDADLDETLAEVVEPETRSAKFLDQARQHLDAGPKPTEPAFYSGDNSDLAGNDDSDLAGDDEADAAE